MRARLLVLSLIAGGIIIPASSALASSGGIGVRLLDSQASSADPLNRSYIVARLAPGATVRRRVEISNTTHSVATVAVYVGGASLRRGRFEFVGGRRPLELSAWTSVSQSVLHMAPGSKAVTTVTTRVPADVTYGERYAVVWAAVSAAAPSGAGVTLVNRVGVRMYISVASGGPLPANFVLGSLETARSAAGTLLIAARVHNSGARTLEIGGTLTLSNGPGGLRAGPIPVRLGAPLAPGAAELAQVQLDGRLPRGPWQARMQLRSGRIHRSADATITFPAVTSPTPVGRHWPYSLIFMPAALLVAAAGLLFARRRVNQTTRPASTSDGRMRPSLPRTLRAGDVTAATAPSIAADASSGSTSPFS
jgi:hypothetical protein